MSSDITAAPEEDDDDAAAKPGPGTTNGAFDQDG